MKIASIVVTFWVGCLSLLQVSWVEERLGEEKNWEFGSDIIRTIWEILAQFLIIRIAINGKYLEMTLSLFAYLIDASLKGGTHCI